MARDDRSTWGGKSLRQWSLGFGALLLLHASVTILYAHQNLQQTYYRYYYSSTEGTPSQNNHASFEYYQTIPLSQRLSFLKKSTPECQKWAHERPKQVNAFCHKIKCDLHPPIGSSALLREDPIYPNVTDYVESQKNNPSHRCKMLAFSGMHMGQGSVCKTINATNATKRTRGGYRELYAVNLLSMIQNARQTLHPVVILSTLGIEDRSAMDSINLYVEWLRARGATVIVIDGLSFQDHIPPLKHGDLDHQVGPVS